MAYYLLLTGSTIAIFFLQYLIWKKSRNIFLPLATFFLYYWSMLGGWFIVFDALNNNAAAKIGAHYYEYYEKLFPISLNDDYFKTLCFYSLFILCFQAAQLLLLKPAPKNPVDPDRKISIRHLPFMLIALLAVTLSFLFIYPQLAGAYANDESFYLYISRHPQGGTYTLSQIFRTCSAVAATGGLVLLLTGDRSKYFSISRLRFAGAYYAIIITVVMLYVSALGNRHDVIYCGIFCFILYTIDAKKKRTKDYLVIMLIAVLPVFLAELTRSIPLFSAVQDPYKVKFRFQDLNFLGTLVSLALSNEMFVGHMSMYGAMHFSLPFTYGSSFETLLASLIPRIIIPDRPMEIYQYYIKLAMNPGTQGFTINHAAGWYLNFGIAGVIAGGTVIGTLLALATNYFFKPPKKTNFFRLAQILVLTGLISFIPLLVRTGPEGYKGLFFEGICIPLFIFWAASIKWKKPVQEIK